MTKTLCAIASGVPAAASAAASAFANPLSADGELGTVRLLRQVIREGEAITAACFSDSSILLAAPVPATAASCCCCCTSCCCVAIPAATACCCCCATARWCCCATARWCCCATAHCCCCATARCCCCSTAAMVASCCCATIPDSGGGVTMEYSHDTLDSEEEEALLAHHRAAGGAVGMANGKYGDDKYGDGGKYSNGEYNGGGGGKGGPMFRFCSSVPAAVRSVAAFLAVASLAAILGTLLPLPSERGGFPLPLGSGGGGGTGDGERYLLPPFLTVDRREYGDPAEGVVDVGLFVPELLSVGRRGGADSSAAANANGTALSLSEGGGGTSPGPMLRVPIPTHAFWTNLVLRSNDGGIAASSSSSKRREEGESSFSYPVVAYPYAFKWNPSRVQVSYPPLHHHTDRISIRDEFSPDLTLGTKEAARSRGVSAFDPLSVANNWTNSSGGAAEHGTAREQRRPLDSAHVRAFPRNGRNGAQV